MILFTFSLIVFFVFILSFIVLKKLTKKKVMFVVAFSIWILFINEFPLSVNNVYFPTIATFLINLTLSILNVIKIFLFSKDFELIVFNGISANQQYIINLWYLFLYIFAPALTASVIIENVNKLYINQKITKAKKEAEHIFYKNSEKHKKISENLENKKQIFTDVDKEPYFDNGILYTNLNINNFVVKNEIPKIYYFLDGERRSVDNAIKFFEKSKMNTSKDLILVKDYKKLMETYLNSKKLSDDNIRVRLLNEPRYVIYNYFYNNKQTFERMFNSKSKIAVVGNNEKTTEISKLLLWLSQTLNVELNLTLIVEDYSYEEKLSEEMPGIFTRLDYTDKYDIDFVTVPSLSNIELSRTINGKNIDLIFLFKDESIENIKSFYYLKKFNPETEIYLSMDDEKIYSLSDETIKEKSIVYFDYIREFCSKEKISDLESKALMLHKAYESEFIESTFYNNQYNYYSSMARALGSFYEKAELSEFDKKKNEHNRWSIYLLTEGWTFSKIRNNQLKQHNLLIPFEELSQREQKKDLNIQEDIKI